MRAIITSTAALAALFSGVLSAADPQLLNLVMPDVKVMADVNVAQAKTSPFGQYVLMQVETQSLQQIAALTGFDPANDVNELLVAGNGAAQHAGLALASGNFNVAAISSFVAKQKVGTETYRGVTIFEEPKKQAGLAFLSGSIAAAGDLTNLKAAIDRLTSPSILPASLLVEVGQLSAANDAWLLTTVPPSSLKPSSNAPAVPGIGNGAENMLGTVQSANAGIKFGANVVIAAQAQADTAQNATSIASLIQFLVNMAQMKAADQPQVQALAKSLTVGANGTTVNISLTMPAAQFQELLQPKAAAHHRAHAGQ
ncbi:MAG TPA: hypothetical protein VIN93_10540 [Bryobacteraceae bacterium]|jgi:hypothetical protein